MTIATWQDVDAMWQADAMAEWERLNEPDPFEKEMIKAAIYLKNAIENLDKAVDKIIEAQSELEGSPMEDVVGSYVIDMENLISNLKSLENNYERGQRE